MRLRNSTMGVLLTPIVVRHATSLEALRGRSVAIDGNLELYQFLSIMRTRDGRPLEDSKGRITSHLNGMAFRTTRLIADYDIRPVFVFDGPPPELKREEIRKRREAREKSIREYEAAVASGDTATAWSKAVMTSRLTRAMVDEAKTLLTLLGIPWVQAPSEGEAQAAFLARRGDVWAAGSKDYDSLLFGAPRLLRFLAVASSEFLPSAGRSRAVPPELLDLEENLRLLGLSREQLIDVAILVGTDFDEGVKGIGPKTAVKRIREWGSLDRSPAEIVFLQSSRDRGRGPDRPTPRCDRSAAVPLRRARLLACTSQVGPRSIASRQDSGATPRGFRMNRTPVEPYGLETVNYGYSDSPVSCPKISRATPGGEACEAKCIDCHRRCDRDCDYRGRSRRGPPHGAAEDPENRSVVQQHGTLWAHGTRRRTGAQVFP